MTRAAPRIVLLVGGLVLAALTSAAAQAPVQTAAPPTAQPSAQGGHRGPPSAAPQGGVPAPAPQGARPQGGVTPNATDRGAVTRRRDRTYAGCNRAALRRALKGGERRRFITRCRLGYDIPPRPR